MKSQIPEKNPLSDQTILFLSLPRHDGKYTSTPWQISTELAKTNTVIFVDHPFTFIDALLKIKNLSIRKRFKAYAGKDSLIKDNVVVILSPFVWPVNFLPQGKLYNFFSSWNQRMLAARINQYFKKNKIESVIYINSFNFYFPGVQHYLQAKISLNVYHCIDPMVKAFTLKHGLYLQQQAAHSADLIISTAPALQQDFAAKGFTKNYLVPNAANFDLFSKALGNIDIHAKLKNISGKVLGYLGNIERRIDFKLLQRVMELLPDWTLAMVGPVDRSYIPDVFFNQKNIHLLGSVSHDEAPHVIKRFDVAIIPFQCDDVSRGIYPLKLYEYLAAGKPVVSTNFNPEVLATLSSVVQVANTSGDFVEHILLAYATDSPEKREERVHIASQNTWKERVKVFSNIIEQELLQKRNEVSNTINTSSLKEKIKSNPKLKALALSLIFRRKPYGSRVRWYIWLWLIFPRYFKRGISWASRLDLVPFNKFEIGKYSRIEQGVVINNGMGDVIIKEEVHTGIGCIIIGPVTLHKHVGLSQYVRILGMHHGSDADVPHHFQPCIKAPIILEEDAWIGTGSVIMGKKNGEALVLGRYCRIGANSVVMTDIPPYSVAVGSPAKVVRVWNFENRCWVKPGKNAVTESISVDTSLMPGISRTMV
jgi:teichuronic acid biosynthesis glycosyltransferase TuaH